MLEVVFEPARARSRTNAAKQIPLLNNALIFTPVMIENSSNSPLLRPLAIYLPQFHPVRENDEWWGKGFTEWTNVTKAKPRFPGHYQPHLPADLGFYDLRLAEIRQQQADMARKYGIYGFCYYHYWFNGRRILERPFNEVLASGEPNFPFCLCWANENWTRRWDGLDKEVLLKQNYNEQDDLDHLRALAPAFADSRYIRVDGKPVFIIYRSELFPDIQRTLETWRKEALRLGIGELYLVRMESFERDVDPKTLGFDAAVEFQPDWTNMPSQIQEKFAHRVTRKLGVFESFHAKNREFDYQSMTEKMMKKAPANYKLYPGVTPSWDNSARRQAGATAFSNSTPAFYEHWLRHTVEKFKPFSKEENFIFINAWNEWAEGNHLEPCQRWGTQYLEATQKALQGFI